MRRDLEARGCLVPQPWDARAPQNVVRGAFTAARAREWAVLCSVRGTSQILIYRSEQAGTGRVVDSLERAADGAWVQGIGGGRWGYSRLLRVLPRGQTRRWREDGEGNPIPRPVDHDALEQVFLDKAAEAFYFAAGRWYRTFTAD